MKNTIALAMMLKIYGPITVDWMGFKIDESNPLTFHHIHKKSEGGGTKLENGALIGKKSHRYLNILEVYRPELHDEWNVFFATVNESRRPMNEELKEWMRALKKRTTDFIFGEYKNIKTERYMLKLAKRGAAK